MRTALLAVGGLLLAGAAALTIAGCPYGVVLRLAVPGAVLLFALAVEQWRYKSLVTGRPSPGWVATDERFIDPESDKLVTVFHKPSTGERCYVSDAVTAAPQGQTGDTSRATLRSG